MNTPQNQTGAQHQGGSTETPTPPNTLGANNTQGPAANAGNSDATQTDTFNPAIQGTRMKDLH